MNCKPEYWLEGVSAKYPVSSARKLGDPISLYWSPQKCHNLLRRLTLNLNETITQRDIVRDIAFHVKPIKSRGRTKRKANNSS